MIESKSLSLEVYLDHLIQRENLRYKRATSIKDESESRKVDTTLRISDLTGEGLSSRLSSLRKPDFQRATWAWTPEQCVSLLDTLIKGQVIPSIIMWSSADGGYEFILDGAHRVSVVIAWLLDDWGDKLSSELYRNESRENDIKLAANAVRQLVESQIGSFTSYEEAEQERERIVQEGKYIPRDVMTTEVRP